MTISGRTRRASSPCRTATWPRWRTAITDDVVAVLLEPIQGEAGVVLPPPGYLAGVREVTSRRQVLFIADEIQSGLGRTGRTLACEHEGVVADVYLLGKALGRRHRAGLGRGSPTRDVLGVLQPGQHGSTFGGNPLACAVGRAVVELLATGEYQQRATRAGRPMRERLDALVGRGVVGGPVAWPVGRGGHRPESGQRPRASARRWPGGGSWPRTPTARPSGWPRRS